MVETRAERVVERYLAEVLNGAGPASVRDLVSNEALRQRIDGLRTAFPDLSVETRQTLAQGALVAVHAVGRGTHEGLFGGCPPTGRSWTATSTAIYRVQEGRIADSWVNWDVLAVLEQLDCVERAAIASA